LHFGEFRRQNWREPFKLPNRSLSHLVTLYRAPVARYDHVYHKGMEQR